MASWTGIRIEADTVLPSQFFTPSNALSPELKLRAAVLEEAFNCLNMKVSISGAQSPDAAERRRRCAQHDAAYWFQSEDRRWPFSFVNICEALGLDPSCVRNQIGKVVGPFYLETAGIGQKRPVLHKSRAA